MLAGKADSLVPPLLRMACGDEALSTLALTSLVNLSGESQICAALVARNLGSRALDWVAEGTCPRLDLLTALLANVSGTPEGAENVLQGKDPLRRGALLSRLMMGRTSVPKRDGADGEASETAAGKINEKATKASATSASSSAAAAAFSASIDDHVGSLAANVARLPDGRAWLLEPGLGALRALSDDFGSASENRRRGAASALRNLAVHIAEDSQRDPKFLEKLLDEEEAWTAALRALDRPRAEGDAASTDVSLRRSLAEAVLCLAREDAGCKLLWKLEAPEALRTAYEEEEDPETCAALEATAEIFLSEGFAPAGADDGDQAHEGGVSAAADAATVPGLGFNVGGLGMRSADGAVAPRKNKPVFEELD